MVQYRFAQIRPISLQTTPQFGNAVEIKDKPVSLSVLGVLR